MGEVEGPEVAKLCDVRGNGREPVGGEVQGPQCRPHRQQLLWKLRFRRGANQQLPDLYDFHDLHDLYDLMCGHYRRYTLDKAFTITHGNISNGITVEPLFKDTPEIRTPLY